jgi:outer membrane receptor protein involved in Fe transport
VNLRFSIVALVAICWQASQAPPGSWGGKVIDARTRSAVVGARVMIVGERGMARTDDAGRFEWPGPPPLPPVTIVVVLPDGSVARSIRVDEWPRENDLLLTAEAAVTEGVNISGVAPTIDTALNGSTALLPRADLEMRHPATLTQSLENVPGVNAISDGGEGAVPAIRGLGRGRSLILVDGGRVTTERRAGPNASFLDPADIDSVEIARGPASVAYGSDAFGGVIAVQTRRAPYRTPLDVRVSGTAGAGIPERRGEIELSRGFGSDALLVSARIRDFGDYRAPAGTVPNSSWRDGGFRAVWDHGGSAHTWSAGWQTSLGRDIGRPRSDTAAIVVTTPYEDSHRLTASYETRSVGWFQSLHVDGLFGVVRERTRQDRVATPRQPRNVSEADTSYRDAQVRMTGDHNLGPVWVQAGADMQGRYGLETDDRTIAYNSSAAVSSISTNPSIASAHRTGLGVFGQATAQVRPRIRLTGGLRGDTVHNTNLGGFLGDRHITNGAVAGLAGATVSVASGATITAQIARGFRDPTLTERFYRGPNGRGFIQGNPDLRPETSRQFDLSGRWEVSRVHLAGTYYDYRIANLVERYTTDGTSFLFRNRGAAELRGVEVEAQSSLPHRLVLEVTADASRGRDADTGVPLDDVAPRSMTLVLRYTTRARVQTYLRAAALARHTAAGPNEVPTPGFVPIDAGVVWHSTSRVEVRGVFRNLLDDQAYFNAGPRWVYAPGRNAAITVAVQLRPNQGMMRHP